MSSTRNVLILGATSEIAELIIPKFSPGDHLYLTGRNSEKLSRVQKIATGAGIQASSLVVDFDTSNFDPHHVFGEIRSRVNAVMLFAGDMGSEDLLSIDNLEKVHRVNFLNPAKAILYFIPELEKKPESQITVVSSVAGDRGRKKNFVYGSAKGALTLFSSGLRGKLAEKNIAVTTIILGLVDTWMTKGMQSPLIAKKEKVATLIFSAMQDRENVVYIPGFWRWIMFIIRLLPEKMFKKMSF